jgi:hypothetical protein
MSYLDAPFFAEWKSCFGHRLQPRIPGRRDNECGLSCRRFGEARLLWSNKVWKLKWYGTAARDLWD